MLEKINELVANDWAADMEVKAAFDREFTQEESKEMARTMAKIYSISHAIDCDACRRKYQDAG